MNTGRKRWFKRQSSKFFRGVTLSRYWQHLLEFSVHNVNRALPMFEANSGGSYWSKAPLTIRTANQTVPLMMRVASHVSSLNLDIVDIEVLRDDSNPAQQELAELFDFYGSDKAGLHKYHLLYGHFLRHKDRVGKIFEIGLGTNNVDVVSNMGWRGKPGASLRAFRDYFDDSAVYGADIDRRVLFSEDRIQTFFVDQCDDTSFYDLPESVQSNLDVFIDDGLHAPDANLRSLEFAMKAVRVGGVIVIEDIRPDALPVWQVVAALLGDSWKPQIFRCAKTLVFVVVRPE